jgi:hypothetical protein
MSAVEPVDRQQFHEVDLQLNEVIELLDGGIECALRGEGADVQLVNDAAGELTAGPASIRPLEFRWIEHAARRVNASGLPQRSRIRYRLAVEHDPVVGARCEFGVVDPVLVGTSHERPVFVVDSNRHRFGKRCPHG